MAGSSVVTMGEETEWSLYRSSKMELFHLVQIYSGDGLEVAGSLAVTQEENLHS